MKSRLQSEGFTLIELLIVIIIIGILAAIAIPMFISQRDKARDAAVKGGVHNIELGIASWGIDHGDMYPTGPVTRASLVGPGGIAYVDNWPANPWTNVDMTDQDALGDYTYVLGTGSLTFKVTGHLSAGGSFVVP